MIKRVIVILEYEGKYWTLSGRRLNYMWDKTQDERYFILSLFAIAKELENIGYYQAVERVLLLLILEGIQPMMFCREMKRFCLRM